MFLRFLLDSDDDWQEGVRRRLFPRIHGPLEWIGDRIGVPLFAVNDTPWRQFVGRVEEDEDVIEEELVELGFERNPIACFKSLRDGRPSEGSWVLRSHDDPNERLDRDRQLHLTMFEPMNGQHGRVIYAHEEQDWQDDPLGHLRGVDYDSRAGVVYARELLNECSFLLLDER